MTLIKTLKRRKSNKWKNVLYLFIFWFAFTQCIWLFVFFTNFGVATQCCGAGAGPLNRLQLQPKCPGSGSTTLGSNTNNGEEYKKLALPWPWARPASSCPPGAPHSPTRPGPGPAPAHPPTWTASHSTGASSCTQHSRGWCVVWFRINPLGVLL